MTRALIAEDEPLLAQELIDALRAVWPELRIVATAGDGPTALRAFEAERPALLFLDVEMPGLSGLQVAELVTGRAHVVFVTAYEHYAVQAFDAGAVDYLLKPVDPARLAQTVQRLRAAQASAAPDMAALLQQLAGTLRRPAPLAVLQAAVGREVRLIRTEEVVYFESDSRYTRVVYEGAAGATADALIRTPLKELLTQLDEQLFWQVHRSVIVNHRHIASAVPVDEGHMHLTLRGRPETLPVSRHFQSLFKGQ